MGGWGDGGEPGSTNTCAGEEPDAGASAEAACSVLQSTLTLTNITIIIIIITIMVLVGSYSFRGQISTCELKVCS